MLSLGNTGMRRQIFYQQNQLKLQAGIGRDDLLHVPNTPNTPNSPISTTRSVATYSELGSETGSQLMDDVPNPMYNSIKCYLIGKTTLLVRCAELLLKLRQEILGIVSDDQHVTNWATEHHVPIVPFAQFAQQLQQQPCDYVFSIFNPRILREQHLQAPRCGIINCHDALLPRYGGVNAVPWAISRQESQHGVTWHVMDLEVDAGAILQQSTIKITADTTTYTLRVQILDKAYRSFCKLLKKIFSSPGLPPGVEQDQQQRLYFGRHQVWQSGGVIDFASLDANSIHALVRASDMGRSDPNMLGVCKIRLPGAQRRWLIVNWSKLVGHFQTPSLNTTKKTIPGQILDINNDYLTVACGNSTCIGIRGFCTLDGQVMTTEEVVKHFKIQTGAVLNKGLVRGDYTTLDSQARARIIDEAYWVKSLQQITPPQLVRVYNPKNDASIVVRQTQQYSIIDMELPELQGLNANNESLALAAVILALHDLSMNVTDPLTIGYHNSPDQAEDIYGLSAEFLPLHSRQQYHQCTLSEAIDVIGLQLNKFRNTAPYWLDVFRRYPVLSTVTYMQLQTLCFAVVSGAGCIRVEEVSNFRGEVLMIQNDDHLQIRYRTESVQLGWVEEMIRSYLHYVNEMRMCQQQGLCPQLCEIPRSALDRRQHDLEAIPDSQMQPDIFHSTLWQHLTDTNQRLAITSGAGTVTYCELLERVYQLVAHFKANHTQITTQSVIAVIMAPDSINLIVAMLSIWHIGAVYLPIDNKAPPDRIKHILDNSRAVCILSDHVTEQAEWRSSTVPCVQLPLQPADTATPQGYTNTVPHRYGPLDAVYTIYTSGSTGLPKGVSVQSAAISNTVWANIEMVGLSSVSTALLSVPYYFDPSVMLILSVLVTGSHLIMKPQDVIGGEELHQLAEQHNMTHLTLTPGVLQTLDPERLQPMTIVVGGEACPPAVAQQYAGKHVIINQYGPTEAAVMATAHRLRDTNLQISIGRPIRNVHTYVLDTHQRHLPDGIAGELFIGGVGVALGYQNKPELTAQKFVDNPFDGGKMYRTGDSVYRDSDGLLYFVGRMDSQIKLRGYRIELEEIEKVAADLLGVTNACCTVSKDKLVLYYSPETVEQHLLQQHLSAKLAKYMIPEVYIPVHQFKFTGSGKIDRKTLPAPDSTMLRSNVNPDQVPSNAYEKTIHDLWVEVLGVLAIGVNDDFNSAGGDSLRAVRLANKIQSKFSASYTVADLFAWPTISSSAKELEVRIASNSIKRSGSSTRSLLERRKLSVVNAQISQTSQQGPKELSVIRAGQSVMQASVYVEADMELANVSGDEEEETSDLSTEGNSPVTPRVETAWPPRDVFSALASKAQTRIYLDEAMKPESRGLYNTPFVYKIQQAIHFHLDVFLGALRMLAVRHATLRTQFHMQDSDASVIQTIVDASEMKIPVTRRTLTAPASTEDIQNAIQQQLRLDAGQLIHVTLLQTPDQGAVLCWTVHHIATDGWSRAIILRELSILYNRLLAGTNSLSDTNHTRRADNSALPPLQIRYIDYSHYDRQLCASDDYKDSIGWWTQLLSGSESHILDLPLDRHRPAVRSGKGHTHHLKIDPFVVKSMLDWQAGHAHEFTASTSLYMVLVALVKTLLFKQCNSTDICVGAVNASRYRSELHPLVGFFVNTMAYRTQIDPNQTFFYLLDYISCLVSDTVMGPYSQVHFEDVLKSLNYQATSTNTSPLFQVMVSYNDASATQEKLQLDGVGVLDTLHVKPPQAVFDLTFEFEYDRNTSDLTLHLEYATDIFDDRTAQTIASRLQQVAHNLFVLQQSQGPLSQVSIVLPDERLTLNRLNETSIDFGSFQSIPCLFLEAVKREPEKVVLRLEDRSLTAMQLHAKSSQVASSLLTGTGLQPGKDIVVAQLLPRGVEMIIGIMAIQLSGGVYLPLNIKDPVERLKDLLNSTKCHAVVTVQEYAPLIAAVGYKDRVIYLDDSATLNKHAANLTRDSTISKMLHENNLAYLLFTSGSTGRPKSVMIKQRGLYNLVKAMNHHQRVAREDVMLQWAMCSFDQHIHEVFSSLLNGATLVLLKPDGNLDMEYMAQTVSRHRVTQMFLVPSQFTPFHATMESIHGWHLLSTLRQMYFGGEAVPMQIMSAMQSKLPRVELINGYGPAECSVYTTYHIYEQASDQARKSVPIGRPLSNYRCYVVDQYGVEVPVGSIGELYIGGDCLFAGYLNQPTQTSAQLFSSPTLNNGMSLYKTGDLVRVTPDGLLEHCGRSDFQVKLRGQRLEIGEIEAVIMQYTGVRNTVVMKREERVGFAYLAAYVQHDDAGAKTQDSVHRWCKERLPAYMVPTAWCMLRALPLNANGKVDRKQLPAPRQQSVAFQGAIVVPPTNLLETKLRDMWGEVLDMPAAQISTDVSFKEYGGDSLMSQRLTNMIRKQVGSHFSIGTLFQHPTIYALALELAKLEKQNRSSDASCTNTLQQQYQHFTVHTGCLDRVFSRLYTTLQAAGFILMAYNISLALYVGYQVYTSLSTVSENVWMMSSVRMPCFIFSIICTLMLLQLLWKWLLMGWRRDYSGVYPVRGTLHLRHWFLHTQWAFVASLPLVTCLKGTVFYNIYLYLMGVRVSMSAHIYTHHFDFIGPIQIGRHSMILEMTSAKTSHIIHMEGANCLHVSGIRVDAYTVIGERSVITPGTQVGVQVHASPFSTLSGTIDNVSDCHGHHRSVSSLELATDRIHDLERPLWHTVFHGLCLCFLMTIYSQPAAVTYYWYSLTGQDKFLFYILIPAWWVLWATMHSFIAIPLFRYWVGFTVPGKYSVSSWYFLHKHWLHHTIMSAYGPSLSLSAYIYPCMPFLLRCLGSRIDRNADLIGPLHGYMSTPFNLLHLGTDVLTASCVTYGATTIKNGLWCVSPVEVADGSFSGNYAVIEPGVHVGRHSLLGSLSLIRSAVEYKDQAVLLGIPATSVPFKSDTELTDDSRPLPTTVRFVAGWLTVLIPNFMLLASIVPGVYSILALYSNYPGFDLKYVFLTVPLVIVMMVVLLSIQLILSKWVCMLHFQVGSNRIASTWWLRRQLYACILNTWVQFAGVFLAQTEFLCHIMRLMGAVIGERCIIHEVLVETDLITIGDGVVVEPLAIPQAHTFEFGRMRQDKIAIAGGTILRSQALLLPGSQIGADCIIDYNTLIMRNQTVDNNQCWQGNPAVYMCDNHGPTSVAVVG